MVSYKLYQFRNRSASHSRYIHTESLSYTLNLKKLNKTNKKKTTGYSTSTLFHLQMSPQLDQHGEKKPPTKFSYTFLIINHKHNFTSPPPPHPFTPSRTSFSSSRLIPISPPLPLAFPPQTRHALLPSGEGLLVSF